MDVPTTECWPWPRLDRCGYGKVNHNGVRRNAHRALWIEAHGDPGDLDIDHLCRNPACVRLDHLEAVTHAENMRRMRRTVCAKGHPMTPENTLRWKRGNKRPGYQRKCRACRYEWERLNRGSGRT